MSTERWRDRVRKAWQDVNDARDWRLQVDDDAAEQRVKDARSNFWRALASQPPMPPEVSEALRRLDEFCEDHPYPLDDDPVLMARNEELQAQVYAAEEATGYRVFRGDRRKSSDSPPPDDGEVSGDWFAERRAKTWGVIQPDGTVVAKGFLGDADAQEDMAVHPPGAIAVHGASGWTNAATGHPASEGPARRPDEDPPPTEQETPMAPSTTTGSTGGEGTPDVHDRRVGRWYDDKPITSTNTASTGGSMASIDEARAAIMAGIEEENSALGALQSAKSSLEEAQNMLMLGTQGSNQSEADQAHAQLADAMSKIDEACQQVASTLQEFENVANRL